MRTYNSTRLAGPVPTFSSICHRGGRGLTRYEPARRRVACGIAAAIMSAVTIGLMVVLPAKLEEGSHAPTAPAVANSADGTRMTRAAAAPRQPVPVLRTISYGRQ
jgi:hypothetical protein